MSVKVAFIGLGRMGGAIAANVLKGGFALSVWNRTRSKCEALAAAGAAIAETPFAAARSADVVLTSLMDDRSILDVLEGEKGILAGLQRGATHACLTTISPTFADRLALLHSTAGSRYVSAPVSGRPNVAAAGQLVSYLAGDAEGIEAVRPVALTYSKSVNVVPGPARVANSIKLAMNFNAVALIELIGETYAFAEASGVDTKVIEEFYDAVFAHPGIKHYVHGILHRHFDAAGGFSMTGGLKDVTLMLAAAKAVGTPLEIGEIVSKKMHTAIDRGWKDRDWSALTEITRPPHPKS
jgi:3-hydroxyisobutyrate dehydrogenase-like beta-hydroxyacid dehydrogenase